jgi:hypothetical protein
MMVGEEKSTMPRYKVAHVKEQGVDLIIIPLESRFGSLGNSAQNAQSHELQIRANSAGLAGTVVPVWDAGNNRMGFLAPNGFRPFFSGLTLYQVEQSINKEISW